MSDTMVQLVLWALAGVVLFTLMARRRKRREMR